MHHICERSPHIVCTIYVYFAVYTCIITVSSLLQTRNVAAANHQILYLREAMQLILELALVVEAVVALKVR